NASSSTIVLMTSPMSERSSQSTAIGLDLTEVFCPHAQPFDRHAEPIRNSLSILENTNGDGRTLSQYGMQAHIMNHCRIGSENCRLHRRATCVNNAPMQRRLNNIFEVKLNFVSRQRIGEPIERLL